MKKIYLAIVAAFVSLLVQAATTFPLVHNATSLPLQTATTAMPDLYGLIPDECIPGFQPSVDLCAHRVDNVPVYRLRAESETRWTEWVELGTTRFPDNFMQSYNVTIPGYVESLADWDGSFTILRRNQVSNPDQAQLCLKQVFNGVDIVLDYMPSANAISCSSQSTGLVLIAPENGWYDTFEFTCNSSSSFFYEESGTLTLGDIYFNVMEKYGLSFGNVTMQLDGVAPVEFSVSGDKFYPSSQPSATLTVTRSDKVKFYRVIVFPYDEPAYYSIINDIMQPQPTGSKEYHEYTSDTFEVTLDMPWRYYIVVIPFGESGKCIAPYTLVSIYSNHQQDYAWTPLGTATMTDIIGHVGLPSEQLYDEEYHLLIPPQMREVEVDVRADNPNIFRIRNPFGPTYPLYDNLNHTDPDDDFYLFVDATDPSRVVVTYSMIGFNYGYDNTPLMVFSHVCGEASEDIDKSRPEYWGKYFDKRILLPNGSVVVGGYHIHTFNSEFPDIEILFPGYETYVIEWESQDWDENGEALLNVSNPKITTVDCALIPTAVLAENRYFPERIYDMIVKNEEDAFKVVSYPVADGKAIIKLNDLDNGTYGEFRVVVVQRDAQGTQHGGLTNGPSATLSHPDDQWELLGNATLEENLVLSYYGFNDQIDHVTVPIYENQTQPGLYRLVAPYGRIAEWYGLPYTATDIYIDASNPNRVNFVTDYTKALPLTALGVPTGFVVIQQDGEVYLNTWGNFLMLQDPNTTCEDANYGKFANGIIQFNGRCITFVLSGANMLFTHDDCFFRVTLPRLDGIETVIGPTTDDNDAPAEYFNLQGVRVANPSGGIFIERRGATVTKRYIP